ncbi:hypothetical protein CS542_00275 [Pedobacter sp. IW39]|nr:hypothetical protein CS542_00275 [Pedobacter sp. IW39]
MNVYKSTGQDIKTAYYHYFQALQGVETYRSALYSLMKYPRSTSLLKNGVRNGTALLRAAGQEKQMLPLLMRNACRQCQCLFFFVNRL